MMRRLRRRAFTLVETLLAFALLAGLLAAAVTMLFQVVSLWATQSDDAMLDQHVDGVDRFVRRLLAESGVRHIVLPTPEQVERERAVLALTDADGDLPWIAPLATAGGRLECRLAADAERRLWLCWNTAGELASGAVESHRTLLSEWVTFAGLYRLDKYGREWTLVVPGETMPHGAGAMYALRLEFEHRGRRRALTMPLPETEGWR